jgi:hypothetical protein
MRLLSWRSSPYPRLTLLGLLAVGGFAALGVATASAAQPCTTNTSTGHCYSISIHDNTGPQNGDFETIDATNLTSAHPATEFVSDELWVGTDGSNQDPINPVGPGTFAATGLGDGETPTYGCVVSTVEFFWEELQPNGSYHCFDVSGGAKLGTAYPVSVVDAGGSSSWYINDNEVLVGEATSMPCCSLGNAGGTESQDTSNSEQGSFSGLERESTSGIVSNGWPNSKSYQRGPNMLGNWTNIDNSFTTAQNDSLPSMLSPESLLGATGLAPMRKALRTTRAAPPALAGSELASVKSIAIKAAVANGGFAPTRAVVVPTTRVVAERVSAGAGVNSDPAVYFVVLRGHFTDYTAEMPPRDPQPRGTVLELTINASTNQITDVGVTHTAPNLHRMGAVSQLYLASSNR